MKIRGTTQILIKTIDTTLLVDNLALPTAQLAEGSLFVKSDGTVPFTANINAGSNRVTAVADPVNPQDAATKAYVDAGIQGLNLKTSARARLATNVNIASPGATLDGLTAANGDRFVLDGQTTASQNGIYVFNGASSAMTRATDADTAAKLKSAFVFITEGTHADTGWVLATDNITLGTTSLAFTQFSSAGQVIGGAGLIRTGNQLDIGAGNGIQVNADDVAVKLDTNSGLAVSGTGLKASLSGSTLAVDATGLKLATAVGSTLASGTVLLGNAGGTATATTLSGDATVSNSGVVTVSGTNVLLKANYVARETPSGAINGTNKAFTLTGTPLTNTETVFWNGLLQIPGTDYTIAGATITMTVAPLTGDSILASYVK